MLYLRSRTVEQADPRPVHHRIGNIEELLSFAKMQRSENADLDTPIRSVPFFCLNSHIIISQNS